MKKHSLIKLIFPLIAALLILTGCMDENVSFIQGRWANGDVHVWSEWIFERGTFTHSSTIDIHGNVFLQTGNYVLLSSDENSLVLELYNVNGNEQIEERTQLPIKINREQESISIGRNTFYRSFNRT